MVASTECRRAAKHRSCSPTAAADASRRRLPPPAADAACRLQRPHVVTTPCPTPSAGQHGAMLSLPPRLGGLQGSRADDAAVSRGLPPRLALPPRAACPAPGACNASPPPLPAHRRAPPQVLRAPRLLPGRVRSPLRAPPRAPLAPHKPRCGPAARQAGAAAAVPWACCCCCGGGDCRGGLPGAAARMSALQCLLPTPAQATTLVTPRCAACCCSSWLWASHHSRRSSRQSSRRVPPVVSPATATCSSSISSKSSSSSSKSSRPAGLQQQQPRQQRQQQHQRTDTRPSSSSSSSSSRRQAAALQGTTSRRLAAPLAALAAATALVPAAVAAGGRASRWWCWGRGTTPLTSSWRPRAPCWRTCMWSWISRRCRSGRAGGRAGSLERQRGTAPAVGAPARSLPWPALPIASRAAHPSSPPHPRRPRQVTQKKAAAIRQLPELRACLGLASDDAAAAAVDAGARADGRARGRACLRVLACAWPRPYSTHRSAAPTRAGPGPACRPLDLAWDAPAPAPPARAPAEEGRVLTPRYRLLPADLRDPPQLEAALEAAGLDPAAPTFVLSECVLVYLQPQHRCARPLRSPPRSARLLRPPWVHACAQRRGELIAARASPAAADPRTSLLSDAAAPWCAGWRSGSAPRPWWCTSRWAPGGEPAARPVLKGRCSARRRLDVECRAPAAGLHARRAGCEPTRPWAASAPTFPRSALPLPPPQINPHDAFGQQMLLNLEHRGCALLGIEGARAGGAGQPAARGDACRRAAHGAALCC